MGEDNESNFYRALCAKAIYFSAKQLYSGLAGPFCHQVKPIINGNQLKHLSRN